MKKNISRRSFLKGAAIGAAGLTMAGAGLKVNQARAEDEIAWDAEYDVVVLGYGGAGANAAVAAYENGAKVLLAEKAPEGAEGGNTAVSGQFVMATDDANGLYDYLTTLMGKFQNWDPEAVRAYCEGCAENYNWMVGPMGGDPAVISPVDHPSAGMEANNKDWKLADGSDGNLTDPYKIGKTDYWYYNWAEFPEIPSSKHCLCLTATGTRFDRGYYNLCQNAVKARPIDVWFSAPGKKLITDAEGAVIGVIISKDGQDLKVKANGGVVLTCGGFEHNQEMITSYLQMPYVHQQGGLYNDGDGIKMALGPWRRRGPVAYVQLRRLHLDPQAAPPGYRQPLRRPELQQRHLRRPGRRPFHERVRCDPPRPYLHRRPLDLHPHAPARLPPPPCPCPPTSCRMPISWRPARSWSAPSPTAMWMSWPPAKS